MAQKKRRFRRQVENLIANLRGIPENYKIEAYPREQSVESLIDRVLKRYKIGSESLEDRIRDNWTKIVGPANARHCHPSRIDRDRTLIISVSNPVLRQELQFNKKILLQNLHRIEGSRGIREVIFKAG